MNFSIKKFFAKHSAATDEQSGNQRCKEGEPCSSKTTDTTTSKKPETVLSNKRKFREITPDEDEESDDGNTTFEPNDAMSLVVSYFDKRFKSLEEKFSAKDDEVPVTNHKKKDYKFNKTGNKNQFDVNAEFLEQSECALKFIVKGKVEKAGEMIKQNIVAIKKRNKLIKIADRSDIGWATVREYETDEVASDSDDDKKIKQAEARAQSRLKNKVKKRTFNQTTEKSSTFPIWPNTGFRQQFRNAPQTPQNQSWFPSFQANRTWNRPRFQTPRAEHHCYGCGEKGHWRKDCQKIPGNEKPKH